MLPKLLGLTLLSAFMFTMGVFVGRGTAPVRFDIAGIQARLKSLRQSAFREDVQRYGIDSDDQGERNPLKYREVLRKPTDPAAELPAAASSPSPPSPPKPVPPGPSPTEGPVVVVVPQNVESAHPYILQVAAMKDGDAAAVMVDKLKQRGYPAYVESIEIPGKGLWYRVRVGPFPDLAATEAAQSQLGSNAKGSLILRK